MSIFLNLFPLFFFYYTVVSIKYCVENNRHFFHLCFTINRFKSSPVVLVQRRHTVNEYKSGCIQLHTYTLIQSRGGLIQFSKIQGSFLLDLKTIVI